MTEDIKLLEAVERYILGLMGEEEKTYFEQLRKSNPEVDQLVVEHSFFLQQVDRYDERKTFRQALHETHNQLLENGEIKADPLRGKSRVVYLFHRYKRVGIIAACVAGITALVINSAVIFAPTPRKEVELLKGKIEDRMSRIEHETRALDHKVNTVASQTNAVQPEAPAPIDYTGGGTGFMVDKNGYVITSAHVVDNARHVAVNMSNMDMTAQVVFQDAEKDIAILKITDSRFKKLSASLPYSIKKSQSDLAESIFTLGYPRNDIVYGDGYIAARTGYNGDTLSCQITIPANPGNSGSPILNQQGEIIGMLTGRQTAAEGAVFAINSRYLLSAMSQLQKEDTAFSRRGLPSNSNLKGISRTQQVNKLTDFVYMIKVD